MSDITIKLTPAQLITLYDLLADTSTYVNDEMFTFTRQGMGNFYKIFEKVSSQLPKKHAKVEFDKFKEFYYATYPQRVRKTANKM